MATPNNHYKIGAFVLAGAVIFVGALFAFGARGYFEKRTTYETYVATDVDGLSIGSPVKLRGVTVGKVTRIGFTWNEYNDAHDGFVLVEFEIQDRLNPLPPGADASEILGREIRKGLRARVRAQGITGNSFVSLEYLKPDLNPAQKVSWTPRHALIPSAESQFGQMLASIETTLRNLEKVDLARVSEALERDLVAAEGLLKRAEKIDIAGIGEQVGGLVAELRTSNIRLQGFLEDARGKLREADIAAISRNADGLLSELRDTNKRLGVAIDRIDTGPLNETLANARVATENVNGVLESLRQYPSGFLFGNPPAPARSVLPPSKPRTR